MNSLIQILGGVTLLVSGVACSSNYPTAASINDHYRHAEQWADEQTKLLEAEFKAGKISRQYYDLQVKAIREEIPRKAGELAWAKYELEESRKRSAGVPTATLPVDNAVPSAYSSGSFYQRAGDYGLNSTPYGSPNVQYERTPSEIREIRGY